MGRTSPLATELQGSASWFIYDTKAKKADDNMVFFLWQPTKVLTWPNLTLPSGVERQVAPIKTNPQVPCKIQLNLHPPIHYGLLSQTINLVSVETPFARWSKGCWIHCPKWLVECLFKSELHVVRSKVTDAPGHKSSSVTTNSTVPNNSCEHLSLFPFWKTHNWEGEPCVCGSNNCWPRKEPREPVTFLTVCRYVSMSGLSV